MNSVERILRHLSPATLRELAAIKERSDPERIARQLLPPEGAERLAEILLSGSTPTVGFWRRWRGHAAVDDALMPAESGDNRPLDLFELADTADDVEEVAA